MQNPSVPLIPEIVLGEWMNFYYAFIYRLAYSILEDVDDAEDAAQQTFINAGLHVDDFAGRSSPRTWLAAIAINQCRAELRRRRARRLLESSLGVWQRLLGGSTSGENQVLEDERHDRLVKEVRKLNEKHRLPLLLRYVHGLTVMEIAGILDISEGTVHSRLHYARRQLAGQIGLCKEDFQEVA